MVDSNLNALVSAITSIIDAPQKAEQCARIGTTSDFKPYLASKCSRIEALYVIVSFSVNHHIDTFTGSDKSCLKFFITIQPSRCLRRFVEDTRLLGYKVQLDGRVNKRVMNMMSQFHSFYRDK